VGANLVEAAGQRDWQVRAMHRTSSNLKALAGLSFETALGDVTEPDSLAVAMKDVDVVFHVAAVATYWKSDVKWMYHVNIEGTRNVLNAAHAAGVKRVVYTSSAAVLGQPPFGQAVDETAPFNLRPDPQQGILRIELHGQANPAHNAVVNRLCEELNATETVCPGTDPRLQYIPLRPSLFPAGQDV